MRIQKLDENSRKNLLEDLLKRSPNNYGQYEQGVTEILANVKANGDQALFEYTKKFDQADLNAGNIKVTDAEIEEAYALVDPKLVEIIRKSLANIRTYHEKQRQTSWFDSKSGRNDPWTESDSTSQSRCVCTRWKGSVSIFCIDEHCTGKGSWS